jgi:hypothetical protein
VVLLGGRVHEDVLARTAALDADDPPYAAYVARIPWLAASRLRRADPGPGPGMRARFTGAVEVEVLPGVAMVDEDSELRGHGLITLTPGSSGVDAAGLFRVQSGFYANYGEVFTVQGGAVWFPGRGISPAIAVRAAREIHAPLGSELGERLRPFHGRFPELEFFAQGTTDARLERVQRLAILPEERQRLARLLLTGVEAGYLEGARYDPLWVPAEEAGLVGGRGAHHSVALLWSYVSNELYDFVPPRSRGWMRAGHVAVGAGFPTGLVLAPLVRGGIVFGEGEVTVSQVLADAAPGVRLRWRRAGFTVSVFDEPRFRAVGAAAFPGWDAQRRTGIGMRWSAGSGGR